MFSIFGTDPDKLLKQATAKKKAGDLDAAIDSLRKAYKQIARSSVNYGLGPYLRLPMYLQQAGRNDEAWSEFNKLIAKGYPNQMRTRQLLPMDHSQIYDKMRLFLQREKNAEKAVKFGIYSQLSWAQGLHFQKRNDELENYLSEESLDNLLVSLLKKTNKSDEKDNLLSLTLEGIRKFPKIDYVKLGKKIDSIMLG